MKFVDKRDSANTITPTHHYYVSLLKPYIKRNKTHVLDIGCWAGAMEELLKEEGCMVTGIDIEKEPLVVVKKRFPKFHFVQASVVEPLPFKKNTFDITHYSMVIEHIPPGTELQSLKNINRVMKKNGHLLLSTMHSNILSNLLDPAYFLTGHRHYTRQQLETLLKKSGFVVKDIYYNGGFRTSFYIWTLYFFKHVLRRKEPQGKLVDNLIKKDYQNKGFTEIDIHAIKSKEL